MAGDQATRADYAAFRTITTRWMDNDVYQHVNNVVYYSFFDTAVNQMLIEAGLLDFTNSPSIGLVVETQCRFYASITFPDVIHAGVRVATLGNSSVRYEIGLFRGESNMTVAEGHFVHVYVDRDTRKPVPIPDNVRAFLNMLIP